MATLIPETGAGVTGANTYVTLAEALAYADDRAETLPTDDAALTALLLVGMDWLELKGDQYQGSPTYTPQGTAWPRDGVVVNAQTLANNAIPVQLKSAQIQLAIAQYKGVALFPNVSAKNYVTEKTIGPLTTKYANPLEVSAKTQVFYAENLIAPLMKNSSFGLTCRRV